MTSLIRDLMDVDFPPRRWALGAGRRGRAARGTRHAARGARRGTRGAGRGRGEARGAGGAGRGARATRGAGRHAPRARDNFAAGLRALPGAVGRRRAPGRGRAPPRTGAPGRRGASVRAPGRRRAPLGTAGHRGAGAPPSGHRGAVERRRASGRRGAVVSAQKQTPSSSIVAPAWLPARGNSTPRKKAHTQSAYNASPTQKEPVAPTVRRTPGIWPRTRTAAGCAPGRHRPQALSRRAPRHPPPGSGPGGGPPPPTAGNDRRR